MKEYFIIIVVILCFFNTSAQRKYDYYDGPYIEIKENIAEVKWIENGKLRKKKMGLDTASVFEVKGLPNVDLKNLDFDYSDQVSYDNVSKFVALSDIHGQFDLFLELLKAQEVVDSLGHWDYEDGHLVVVGDVFDRGDKVTETLWFLFNLEKEADKAGGKVHFLLGNHELMVLHNELGYIHPKYRFTAGVSRTQYNDLFSEKTVLGAWIRSKKVAVTINGFAFVHGGFSKALLKKEKSLQKINHLFTNEILKNKKLKTDNGDLLSLLYFENGPLWYRGYANPEGFDVKQADFILNEIGMKTLVVGHTSMPQIVSHYGDRIILVDSSMKFGKTGEILIYENDLLYRGFMDGSREPLISDTPVYDRSAFDYVYDLKDNDLLIQLETNVDSLINNKAKETYQDATLVAVHNNERNRTWNIRLRARGNMRKKLCHLPPIKIDFSKETLDRMGFSNHDKLSLVLPCDNTKYYKNGLFKEYFVYKMYEIIDSMALRTRLINVEFWDDDKRKYELPAFVLEDERNYQKRHDTQIITKGIIRVNGLEREAYLKMAMFQFLILNTDWSVGNRHNLKMVWLDNKNRTVAVPYDFDYSGLVGMDYAVPHDNLPIDDVATPFFRGYYLNEAEMEFLLEYYNSIESDLYDLLEESNYLNSKSKSSIKKRLDKFYQTIRNKAGWKRTFFKS